MVLKPRCITTRGHVSKSVNLNDIWGIHANLHSHYICHKIFSQCICRLNRHEISVSGYFSKFPRKLFRHSSRVLKMRLKIKLNISILKQFHRTTTNLKLGNQNLWRKKKSHLVLMIYKSSVCSTMGLKYHKKWKIMLL